MNFLSKMLDRIPEHDKWVGDGLSASAVIATIMGYLPQATALLSFIWVLLRIWETETVKKWTNRL